MIPSFSSATKPLGKSSSSHKGKVKELLLLFKKSRRKSSSRMLGLNPGVNLCNHFTLRLHTSPSINTLPLGWIWSAAVLLTADVTENNADRRHGWLLKPINISTVVPCHSTTPLIYSTMMPLYTADYFSLCSVSFVLFRGIYYVTPHYYSLSEKLVTAFLVTGVRGSNNSW